MAFLDRRDQFALADGLNVEPFVADTLAVFEFRRLAVRNGEVGDDVLVTLESTELFVAIKELASSARDDSDVRCAEFMRVAVAPCLLDGLVEFGVADAVLLTLDGSVGAFAIIVLENQEVSVVVGGTVRDGDLYANPFRGLAVAVYQFGVKFRPNLFFGV